MQHAQKSPAVVESDVALVRRALAHDGGALRTIMTMHNRKLYRIARSVVGNDSEAEDIVQAAYVSAFTHLGGFRGESSLGTWLSSIVLNEARGRLRHRRREAEFDRSCIREWDAHIIRFPLDSAIPDPERAMAQRQILQLVERATDRLPESYRLVFVARAIEGLSIEETSALLDLKPQTGKTRLHRARHLVRRKLEEEIGPIVLEAFPFAGRRCERLTAAVMAELGFRD